MPTPQLPHLIYGTIYKQGGTVVAANVNVMIVNITKNTILTGKSDSSGRYIFDCANFASYANGDTMEVFAYTDLFSRHVITALTTSTSSRYRFTVDFTLEDNSIGQALITNVGLNLVRDWFGGTSITSPTHTEWNNSAAIPDAADTESTWDTGGTAEQRNAFDSQSLNNPTSVKYQATLTTTQMTSQTVAKSGLFNAASTGSLYAERLYGGISKTSAFNIVETDYVQVV